MPWPVIIVTRSEMSSFYPDALLSQGSGDRRMERSSSLPKGPTVCKRDWATESLNVAISQINPGPLTIPPSLQIRFTLTHFPELLGR